VDKTVYKWINDVLVIGRVTVRGCPECPKKNYFLRTNQMLCGVVLSTTTGRGVTANMSGLGPDDSGFESRRPDEYEKAPQLRGLGLYVRRVFFGTRRNVRAT
jgi:hypothetical protein